MSTIQEQNEATISRVAVGVMYIFLERAFPSFPTSTRAHPSFWVNVERNTKSLLRPGDATLFPFKVRALEWRLAVEPVLSDVTLKVKVLETVKSSLRVERNQRLVSNEAWGTLLAQIVASLVASYQAAGYLPTEDVEVVEEDLGATSAPGGDGEPINRTPWISPGEKYPRYN